MANFLKVCSLGYSQRTRFLSLVLVCKSFKSRRFAYDQSLKNSSVLDDSFEVFQVVLGLPVIEPQCDNSTKDPMNSKINLHAVSYVALHGAKD